MKPEDAPELVEWITASDAADLLGVSRQMFNRMIKKGQIRTLRRLGERPIWVLRRSEAEDLASARTERLSEAADR